MLHTFEVKLASLTLTLSASLISWWLEMRAKNFVVNRVSIVAFRVSIVAFRVSFVAFYRVSFVATPCFNRGQAVVKGLRKKLFDLQLGNSLSSTRILQIFWIYKDAIDLTSRWKVRFKQIFVSKWSTKIILGGFTAMKRPQSQPPEGLRFTWH